MSRLSPASRRQSLQKVFLPIQSSLFIHKNIFPRQVDTDKERYYFWQVDALSGIANLRINPAAWTRITNAEEFCLQARQKNFANSCEMNHTICKHDTDVQDEHVEFYAWQSDKAIDYCIVPTSEGSYYCYSFFEILFISNPSLPFTGILSIKNTYSYIHVYSLM